MEDKLDSLEEEREYLLDLCPVDKQDQYEEGKETTLVRILLRTLPKEYDASVKAVQDLVRLRKASVEGQVGYITNLEVIVAWRLMERRRKEDGKSQKGGHPSLPILVGHEQPGPHLRTCYGCGKTGHMRGDKTCSAGPNGVWDGAPQVWKDRVKKGLNKVGGKVTDKAKTGAQQRNQGKRDGGKGSTKSKEPCHNWSRGNGFCKYADACRFSHDGPQGGQTKESQTKRKGDAVFLATKKGKKARKQLTSLLLKDLKERGKVKAQLKEDESEDDEHLYQLIRGVPTVVIKAPNPEADDFIPIRGVPTVIIKSDGDEFDDFVPQKEPETCEEYMSEDDSGNREYYVDLIDGVRYLQYRSPDQDDICDDNSWEDCDNDLSSEKETTFTVTLMITNSPNDGKGKDESFAPRRPGIRTETNDQSKDESSSENNGRVIKNDTIKFSNEKSDSDSVFLANENWKKRAKRAERLVLELLEERQQDRRALIRQEEGVERVGQRPKLKDSLDLLT